MRGSFRAQLGISLIEVMVGVSMIAGVLVVVGFSVTAFVNARSQLLDNARVVYLTEEGYEMVRALRNDDWSTVAGYALDTTYYLDIATTTIAIGTTPELVDGLYFRTITFREVYRDSDDDITASTTAGATVDTQMREVEVSVGSSNGTTTMRAIIGDLFTS